MVNRIIITLLLVFWVSTSHAGESAHELNAHYANTLEDIIRYSDDNRETLITLVNKQNKLISMVEELQQESAKDNHTIQSLIDTNEQLQRKCIEYETASKSLRSMVFQMQTTLDIAIARTKTTKKNSWFN